MQTRRPATMALTMLTYILVSFAVQGTSHFVINVDHYAGIGHLRADAIIQMGIAAMLIQGAVIIFLFPKFSSGEHPVRDGVVFSWAIGAFLASYIVLAEAAKYTVPSISSWMIVETGASFAQFTVFGVALGFLYRGPSSAGSSDAEPAR